MVASTAAAPAQKAKERALGRLSKALAELVEVPMTWRRAKDASARWVFMGERSGVFLRKGDGEGVSLSPLPQAGLMMRGLFGVSDMARAEAGGVFACCA
jgi:hypothetical protein